MGFCFSQSVLKAINWFVLSSLLHFSKFIMLHRVSISCFVSYVAKFHYEVPYFNANWSIIEGWNEIPSVALVNTNMLKCWGRLRTIQRLHVYRKARFGIAPAGWPLLVIMNRIRVNLHWIYSDACRIFFSVGFFRWTLPLQCGAISAGITWNTGW